MQQLDFMQNQALEELASLVHRQLGVDGILVTKPAGNIQLIVANSGFSLPRGLELSLPLDHSICQHVAAMNYPLVVDDTIAHPLLKGNFAHDRLGIAAFLGVPICTNDENAVGVICAVRTKIHCWTSREVSTIICAARSTESLPIVENELPPAVSY